jgi:predicted AAA+ superfamily ATPase
VGAGLFGFGISNSELLSRALTGYRYIVYCALWKSYWHNGREPFMYFYRDHDQREIDFVLDRNGLLYPMDAKKTARPGKADFRSFKALEKLDKPPGTGAIICLYPDIQPIAGEEILSVPVWEI